MTFTPSVLSMTDSNNTTNAVVTTFFGTPSITTGYNTITLNVSSSVDSLPGGLVLQFSPNSITGPFISYSSDTVFANLPFIKNYPVISPYYQIQYTNSSSAQTNIQSRLSTVDESKENDSMAVFNNDVEASLDAFGKLRVSNPQTLIDIRFPGQSTGSSSFLLNNQQVFINGQSVGQGTYNFTASNSKCLLTVTGTSTLISQSRKYCVYQPGKSLLFLASGVIYNSGNPSNGYTSRIGYYDDRNGLYFQYDAGSGISICTKNNTITSYPQSIWNIDKMDGTGPSKLNLDFFHTQLYVIDMEWLGVGRVRFGFYAFGRIHYCHQILNLNILNEPYTNGINLPIRYEIFGNNSNVSSATMTQICSTVISEGGYNPIGRSFSASTGNTQLSTTNSETPIIALRGGGSNYYHQTILPNSFMLFSTDANTVVLYRIRLYHDSIPFTVSGWTDVDPSNSVAQYALGNNIISFSPGSSIICDMGYFSGKNSITLSNLTDVFNNIFQITQNSLGVSDVLVITTQIVTGNNSTGTFGNINWQEIY